MAGSIEARRSFCREFEQVAITCTPRCLASCMATNESGCVCECEQAACEQHALGHMVATRCAYGECVEHQEGLAFGDAHGIVQRAVGTHATMQAGARSLERQLRRQRDCAPSTTCPRQCAIR